MDADLSRVSALIAERIGLHFPSDRFGDLTRGLLSASRELGFDSVDAFADAILSSPLTREQFRVLVSHLTIGETYFFRETPTWDVLRNSALPDLIKDRRGRVQRLRLWSAACASGEEAYSLAILLHELLPDLADWHVTILASDVNPRSLQKAVAGEYGEWSFRGVRAEVKRRYFTPTGNGRYAIREDIRRLVVFEHVNLVDDNYPSLSTETNAMDVILCRNVLIYFTPQQIERVIAKLSGALVGGGWLVVSPSEASHTLFPQLTATNFPGAILFQKRGRVPVSVSIAPPPVRHSRPQGAIPAAPVAPVRAIPTVRPDFSAMTRALANEGQLDEALIACDRWIASERLFAPAHYIRAMILLERGDHEAARGSLQRALYLDSKFVLAHVALGMLARSRGQHTDAARHFANAQHLLVAVPGQHVLPESDGLTASRLSQTLTSLTNLDRTA